ncbi:bifunctional 4-hydroxy-2-oxoglutarate aldolase/2-dehydro-3-deoxy-phosphogluconate aldolase [Rhodococcus sp. BP-252]|uniref:2-dehydro-3-deoxyphosphogluconate aldolase n=2 Tax=Nocardiaceae TaxID=85025 RepID=A0A177YEK5_9NOCA|nr:MULTISPECIES: bifunctional 4-hydroxy-2-oxoglutarate aldolase/2-dehydro-3-deoxy-phosphogluconate aldolase [Rhodococcus]MBY6414040.1 bifunctional 4-hydroxy-2-oxoglutarate aldolase/2-dehydro-3-deoxy-phosphogluconate aldolase [Rhodococcus sp. BP-320]MBY6418811.1 bifunctional 4-hydroxy-2-oxoglutarate aldolase/2-dehydro-3-deoxy-phosphogluconate aldolase [Rhodococcus sp. BP-321]MBY6423444.1 bifunctional 4-hydroxy-2-oxoglutarate aldolase/2-dehydro-3-deoxy-phosphogluconate aldolase [Rhodococcus sp. BP
MNALQTILDDRALAVVRAPSISDPAALADAVARGGIRAVELTFTTPGVLQLLRDAADAGAVIGAGTVLTGEQARSAIDAGAQFLVTPGLRPEVAEVAATQNIPVMMGALTPTEVMNAIDLGAAAVKIFPARALGPAHFKDLLGPLPDARLVPSGGVNASNAAEFLKHGAVAVTAGTDVVPPASVAASNWDDIASRARTFVESLGPQQ